MTDIGIEFKSKTGNPNPDCPEFAKGVEILQSLIKCGVGATQCASTLINAYSLMIQSAKPETRVELILVLEKAAFTMRHAEWDEMDRLNKLEREKGSHESPKL